MFTLERILVVVVFLLGLVPFVTGTLGAIPSTAVDLLKALLPLFGKQLKEEWGGRLFLLVNFLVFVVVFLATGINPVDYVLPEQADATIKLVLTIATSVVTLAASVKWGQLWHSNVLKSVAPKLFSIKAQAADSPNPAVVEGQARPTPQVT